MSDSDDDFVFLGAQQHHQQEENSNRSRSRSRSLRSYHQQQSQEQQRLDWERRSPDDRSKLLDRFYAVMNQREKLPSRIRSSIDEAVGPFASYFLENIEGCAQELLLDVGLDIHRETEEEVETMIRLFPRCLEDHGYGECPILHAARGIHDDMDDNNTDENTSDENENPHAEHNTSVPDSSQLLKSIPFVPLLAKLGIELGGNYYLLSERGGLLVKDEDGMNVLQLLAQNHGSNRGTNQALDLLVEKHKVNVMKRLRDEDLFRRKDIRRYNLVYELCKSEGFFPPASKRRTRFEFLVDWDPKALAKKKYRNGDMNLPLHHCTRFLQAKPPTDTTEVYSNSCDDRFRSVFRAGMHHFPDKLGFMFHPNRSGQTPYRLACKKYGTRKTHKLIKTALVKALIEKGYNEEHEHGRGHSHPRHERRRHTANHTTAHKHKRKRPNHTHTNTENNEEGTTTLFTSESLLVSVASNPDIDLDGIYFLVRRDPSVCNHLMLSRRYSNGHAHTEAQVGSMAELHTIE